MSGASGSRWRRLTKRYARSNTRPRWGQASGSARRPVAGAALGAGSRSGGACRATRTRTARATPWLRLAPSRRLHVAAACERTRSAPDAAGRAVCRVCARCARRWPERTRRGAALRVCMWQARGGSMHAPACALVPPMRAAPLRPSWQAPAAGTGSRPSRRRRAPRRPPLASPAIRARRRALPRGAGPGTRVVAAQECSAVRASRARTRQAGLLGRRCASGRTLPTEVPHTLISTCTSCPGAYPPLSRDTDSCIPDLGPLGC